MKKLDQNYKEIKKPKKQFVKCQRCKGVFRNDEYEVVRIGGIGSRQINCLKCNSEVRGTKVSLNDLLIIFVCLFLTIAIYDRILACKLKNAQISLEKTKEVSERIDIIKKNHDNSFDDDKIYKLLKK